MIPEIHVLDENTIDKIAAGEVVERPLSVVKELVENAIDAGADAITVEIKDGGISMIRVTDNGSGIEPFQLKTAFLRHATSKIRTAQDLPLVDSLGFRGEALSSIAAVSMIEVITKTKQNLTGIRYILEGAEEKSFEEIGAPDGSTFLVRNLFFNVPVRRNFLKQPATEGSYVSELMEHMAMSRPDISFKYICNGREHFHTSGNSDLREVIYRVYGKETAEHVVEIDQEGNGIRIQGYLGEPVLTRSNRNFETFFVNGRYIKSDLISKAVEDGYKEYLMQHKFPFAVLHFCLDTQMVDVNVHPAKMEVRFLNGSFFFDFIASAVNASLKVREMIPEVILSGEDKKQPEQEPAPEPFERNRVRENAVREESRYMEENPEMKDFMQNPVWNRIFGNNDSENKVKNESGSANVIKADEHVFVEKPVQMDFFEDKILSPSVKDEYRILGQIFDTYWLVGFRDKLLIIDQHAAHEKVKYEALMKQFREKSVLSQMLNPPIVLTLGAGEELILSEYEEAFKNLGFEVEKFGGNEYVLRSVPVDLYGCSEKEMFTDLLDELSGAPNKDHPGVIEERIATMACKAAVKGNNRMSREEAEQLIDQLLSLENPYHCPHGRPTVITVSKYELEKKFKRIV